MLQWFTRRMATKALTHVRNELAQAAPSRLERWVVVRQDYNQNRALVPSPRPLSQSEANAMAEEFQARGHHQTYWARPAQPDDAINSFCPARKG